MRISLTWFYWRSEARIRPHQFVEVDMAMKDKALARFQEPDTQIGCYHPPDDALMLFLQTL